MRAQTTTNSVFVFRININSAGVKILIQVSRNIQRKSIDIWCEKK
jgi:hypothetical protein